MKLLFFLISRCDALNVSLSKSQKKIIKKFNKFLDDGELKKYIPLECLDTTHEGDILEEKLVKTPPLINLDGIIVNNALTETSDEKEYIAFGSGDNVDAKKNISSKGELKEYWCVVLSMHEKTVIFEDL